MDIERLDGSAILTRQLLMQASRGEVEAQRSLVNLWRALADNSQDNPDLEAESMSYALMFARMAEANTGSVIDKAILLNTLGWCVSVRERFGDEWSVSAFKSDALAIIDSAANLPGADDDGETSSGLMTLAMDCTAAEVEAAKTYRGVYDVIG